MHACAWARFGAAALFAAAVAAAAVADSSRRPRGPRRVQPPAAGRPAGSAAAPPPHAVRGAQRRLLAHPGPPPPPARPRLLLLQYVCFGQRGGTGCAASDLWRLVPEALGRGPARLPDPWQPPAPLPCVTRRLEARGSTRRHLLEASGPREPAFYAINVMNKAAYCLRHGYGMRIAGREAYGDVTTRARAWGVIRAIQQAIAEGWDWVLYIDQDTLITEGSIAAHEIAAKVPPGKHLALTSDWNGLNGGIMLWRGSKESQELLRKVWDRGGRPGFSAFHPWTFQLGITTVYSEDSSARRLVHILPQRTMNSYPSWTPGLGNPSVHQWYPGDFNIHFAGCSDQVGRNCEREIKSFVPHVRGLGCLDQQRAAAGAIAAAATLLPDPVQHYRSHRTASPPWAARSWNSPSRRSARALARLPAPLPPGRAAHGARRAGSAV
eukprot:TRINITY_DN2516_c0_g1_i1.p2 TRINITY_DN2516_c0_g1~~TRINITY_DN2516_c0_g1_i1.p2  ORF type:complete len:437 (+),score=84.62 TRINITY_DN2516_c0_g1_i1:78-1388(+)